MKIEEGIRSPEHEVQTRRRLLWYGVLLILLGLLTGLAVPAFTNPRMGLAAHIAGVLNGMLLMILALAWQEAIVLAAVLAAALAVLVAVGLVLRGLSEASAKSAG